jgi:hypothetical protein
MNLAINGWDVPSVNFLGAVDDGTGKWAKGFWHDSLHPNAAGHDELLRTFVPTLFEAIEQGKATPVRSTTAGFARVKGPEGSITFTPDASMHPFAFGITVRASREGDVATVSGHTLEAAMAMKKEERAGGRGSLEFETTTLTAGAPFVATIGVERGVWTYTASTHGKVVSEVKADAVPHHLVLSHYTARGETLFFIDGKLAGRVSERLEPNRFVVGGVQADYKDLMIYRSALNADEIAALEGGRLLQASLEVYSPLVEAQFRSGGTVENLAQSLTAAATVGAGTVQHVDR